jgi:hypothetical protein
LVVLVLRWVGEGNLTNDVETLAGLCFDPFSVDEGLVFEQVWVVEL